MKNSYRDPVADALSVLKQLLKKGKTSQSTTTMRRGKSEASFVVTATTESSDGTGTRIYFEGWLTI